MSNETVDSGDTVGEIVEEGEIKPDTTSPPLVKQPAARRDWPWLGMLNFCLILALVAAAAYYWQQQQETTKSRLLSLSAVQQQIDGKVDNNQLQSSLRSLQVDLEQVTRHTQQLQQQQQDLQAANLKLSELLGRNKDGWQLAEVEYLLRIAQHKLILENDFQATVMILEAASDRIAAIGDVSLSPVRVRISDEIAELKTHTNIDWVGTTLRLAQLSLQAVALRPGLKPTPTPAETVQPPAGEEEPGVLTKLQNFFAAFISVKSATFVAEPATAAMAVRNPGEALADHLKLTRWALLERNAYQYRRLVAESIDLLQQFYNLDDAVNHDFYVQLKELQQLEIRPEKPDISGSLKMLSKVIRQREATIRKAPGAVEKPLEGASKTTEKPSASADHV